LHDNIKYYLSGRREITREIMKIVPEKERERKRERERGGGREGMILLL